VSLSDQLLSALVLYGLPVLFSVNFVSSVGIPIPGSFLLITAGAFSEQGQMNLFWVICLSVLGSVMGDNAGYWLGRWGGRSLALKIMGWLHIQQRLPRVEAMAQKYGGPGVFFTRWLVAQLGAPLNIVSGMICFPWLRFLAWDIAGEIVGVMIYVTLGVIFSENVQQLINFLGSLGYAAVGLIVALVTGWILLRSYPRKK
jgi:membrane-associated protein